ncbi:hypothetical protein KR009_003034, partial [Drosophila setifemur]
KMFQMGEWIFPRDKLLRVCLLIAAFDLLHSLYFTLESVAVLHLHLNSLTILAFLSSVVWVTTVLGLIMGLWKGQSGLLIFWLLYAGFGIVTDTIFLVWNVTSSPVFDVNHFKVWTFLYMGIFFKCTCFYLIYKYFKRLYFYYLLEGESYDWRWDNDVKSEFDESTETKT